MSETNLSKLSYGAYINKNNMMEYFGALNDIVNDFLHVI